MNEYDYELVDAEGNVLGTISAEYAVAHRMANTCMNTLALADPQWANSIAVTGNEPSLDEFVMWGEPVYGPHTPDCPCGECCHECNAQPGWPCDPECNYAAWCAEHEHDDDTWHDMSEATSPAGWRAPA